MPLSSTAASIVAYVVSLHEGIFCVLKDLFSDHTVGFFIAFAVFPLGIDPCLPLLGAMGNKVKVVKCPEIERYYSLHDNNRKICKSTLKRQSLIETSISNYIFIILIPFCSRNEFNGTIM